ncbi:hypothetical protein QBC33DRAFT_595745 [Phialemonium atrogriseum]|uniref:Uncharacterized protein n=1 Tax=Phialemonium atrogriseum TaxID=1093897 RepID=A0AAJ0BU57_9PEZI|nr:uncharacterized protein QBC33DRAFT_595745 [Phialemonium atrogriseum]KAK1764350.1 hypothetical protein QBC33DRAFT_595745 [Phialemonium atrogriseum]
MACAYEEKEDADTYLDVVLVKETGGDDDDEGGIVLKVEHIINGTNLGGEEQPKDLINKDLGKDRLTVKCDKVEIVHGSMVVGGSPATLVVFQFAFVPRARTARFKSAEIILKFSVGEVYAITHEHTFVIMKSTKTHEVSHNVSPSIEAKDTLTLADHARIQGNKRTLLDRSGQKRPSNSVIWSLSENGDTESGIPHLLQTALLLRRAKPADGAFEPGFEAEISIRADVDSKTSAKEVGQAVKAFFTAGSKKGNDIVFNPLPPEKSHPPEKLQPPVNPQSLDRPKPPEMPQPHKIKTPEKAVAVTEKIQPIGREAPSVGADEAVAEKRMTFGLPKAVVLTPEVETLIADVEQEAAAIGADAETEPELQEQLALVRAEASFVKRRVDLEK